jgi:nucleotide-binding universal stress UspA family protein
LVSVIPFGEAYVQRIMVVSDGSEGANRAIDVAAGLAKAVNGILWIVSVRDVKLLTNHMKEIRQLGMSENLLERFTKQILTEAKERAKRLGVSDVRIDVFEGDAAETIIDVVKREQVELLVVGRRGRGALASLALGSVAQKLASFCSCCVMVVP